MPKIKIVKEFSPIFIDPPLPSDPALRAVIDDVLAKFRYAFSAAAAAEEQAITLQGLDMTFKAFLDTRSASARTRLRERSQSLFSASSGVMGVGVNAHPFGRYTALSPKDYRTFGFDGLSDRFGKLSVASEPLVNSLNRLHDRLLVSMPNPSNAHNRNADTDAASGLMFKKMRLFINKVRCKEETDGPTSDEISLGGTKTNPFGSTTIVDQFRVSDDFDEDEVVNFGMSKKFAGWNLQTAPVGFPYVYTAVIAMAEKDDGGFYKFLKALWEEVDGKVKAAIAGLVGAAIGGAIGSVIGAVVGMVVGALIAWIIGLFDNSDDIIAVKTVVMGLASSKKSYYDWANLTAAGGSKFTLNFNGDGGRYVVDCSFKVFTQ